MSGWLGLREEQREAEVLVTLLIASLPPKPSWCIREQARSHIGMWSAVGASLLAKRPEQAAQL
ncbi:hypothetical protein BK675_24835 [Pseudomonas fluorescens]|nr:hypothetical protein BK677_21840 [Pseudomonas fluorescens]ROO04316.1 hypothetical protein BK675_24835 [Pseudomonas fluorescens]ROO15215.1 hypothetical protein BK676_19315 [Pseudomonas fluorescens]